MPNLYWARKAELDIKKTFPSADLMFEPFDGGRELGVCARINNYRRAIRLTADDDWLAKIETLITETAKGQPNALH